MSKREQDAMLSLEVTIDNALYRLSQLEGKDRMAFENEYKEWLVDDKSKEQVWFSIPLRNKGE